MMKRPYWILLASPFLIFGAAHAATPNMKEGLWEVTAQVEEPKGSGAKPTTVRHCMTQKDLQNPQKIVPGGDGECEIRDHKVQGNTVSWAMLCKGKTSLSGTGSITFAETTYTGSSTLAVNRGERTEKMIVRYTGKHVGPCKK